MRLACVALVLVACSASPAPPAKFVCDRATDTYAPGMVAATTQGTYSIRLVQSSKDPPARGLNVWTVQVLDAGGAAIRADGVRLKAWMPDEGRGAEPLWNEATALAGEQSYRVGPFNVVAPGYWEMTVEVTKDGASEEARFAFCVQGEAVDGGVPDAEVAEPDAGVAMPACMTTAPIACEDPSPTYEELQPIFMERCIVCHDGRGEEWPLTTYGHVADWYLEIRAAMLDCKMPPRDAGIAMPDEEREQILGWIRCGLPR